MPFTGQQVNTYGPRPQRAFIMDATRSGLPVTVLHVFADTTATMRAKVLSLFTVVDASGPEMDRGETVTVFNDLVVLAPGAIVDAPVEVDGHGRPPRSRRVHRRRPDRLRVLTFNAEHDLVDFVSETGPARLPTARPSHNNAGRPRSPGITTPTGTGLHPRRGRVARPQQPEGPFTYLEFHLDAITLQRGHAETTSTTHRPLRRSSGAGYPREPRRDDHSHSLGRPGRPQQLGGQVRSVVADLPLFLTSPLFRRWHLRWGATPGEVDAALPGDELLPRAQFRCTRAITIQAPPALVWPWLVQVGCLRAVSTATTSWTTSATRAHMTSSPSSNSWSSASGYRCLRAHPRTPPHSG